MIPARRRVLALFVLASLAGPWSTDWANPSETGSYGDHSRWAAEIEHRSGEIVRANKGKGTGGPVLSPNAPSYPNPDPADVINGEYHAAWERLGNGDFGGAIERLRRYKILFVPGFLSDVVIAAGSFSLMEKIKAGQYFDEQLAWLKAEGIDAERVVIESEESPKHNASIIAAAVRGAGKPVIIISHSKGGVDTLEAMLSDASLHELVRGWIPIQAPFLGSPVADEIVGKAFLRGPAFALMRSLDGSEKSLVSMTSQFRTAYYERHRDRMTELLGPRSQTRVICFASWQENEPYRIDTFMELSRDAMAKWGFENDGLVPWKSAVLPGCAYVAVSGIDHAVPVMATNERPFDRVRFTKTLFSLLLSRMEE